MPRKGENIYKRRDGRWEGRYKVGYTENGKAKYRSVYGKSYHDVKNQLIEYKSIPIPSVSSGNLTVKDLFEEWLNAVKIKVKASTYANYRMKADKHILPDFGRIRYDKLSVKLLHDFVERKIKSGLSVKYVADIVVVFKSMSKYISKIHGFQNPIADAVLPKTHQAELVLYTESQQKKLSDFLMENMNSTSLCIILSLYTGMRIGEVCGLKWSDIDFEKNILTVRRTVQRIRTNKISRKTKLLIDKPKSYSSQRSIPIPTFIISLLKMFRSDRNVYVLSGNQKATEPRTLQHRFKSILKKAQLPPIKYHSLRHMFATNCVAVGFDIKTLSELLGHSSVETTLNRYVHSSMERKKECMRLLKLAA